jgi:hypothetical protein
VTFTDDFNRPDSSALGNGWLELAGDPNIVSQHVSNAPTAGDHLAALPSIAGAVQTVSADFVSGSNNLAPNFGLVLRCQDCGVAGTSPMNYYRIYRATGGSSLLKISRIVGGVETVLKTVSIGNPAVNAAFHLQATANGTTLTVSVGATQTSIADTTFASGAVGFFIRSGAGTPVHQADNFQATVP